MEIKEFYQKDNIFNETIKILDKIKINYENFIDYFYYYIKLSKNNFYFKLNEKTEKDNLILSSNSLNNSMKKISDFTIENINKFFNDFCTFCFMRI